MCLRGKDIVAIRHSTVNDLHDGDDLSSLFYTMCRPICVPPTLWK